MGKRRIRYSSSLAADWVVLSPRTDTVATEKISVNKHTASEIQSIEPTSFHQGSAQKQGLSEADEVKKCARYKKSLPSDWVSSNSEDDPAIESPKPLREYSNSEPHDIELYDAGIGLMPSRRQFIDQSTTPTRDIQNNREIVPPPAPTENKKMYFPFRKPVREQQARSVPQKDTSLNSASARQRSYVRIGPSQLFDDTMVSPPISVRQSSPATTDSPSYGRDLPATAPSISPNYSNC